MGHMPRQNRSMLLEICVLYVRRRCTLQFYFDANTSSVKIVYQNGSRGKGHVRFAGRWLKPRISGHLVTDQPAYFFRYFSKKSNKTHGSFFCFEASCNYSKRRSSDHHHHHHHYRGKFLTVFGFSAMLMSSPRKLNQNY